MSRRVAELPTVAQRELEECCREGMSSEKTRVRLIRCGVRLAQRTISRRMAQWKTERARREERAFELQEIGRGLAMLNAEIGGAITVCNAALPDWRPRHLELLKEGFQDFVSAPTQSGFNALVTGCFTFLVYSGVARTRAYSSGNSNEFAMKSETAKEGA